MHRTWIHRLGSILSMMALLAGCDTVVPESEPLLVVEAFVDAGQPLPAIELRQTRALDDAYPLDGATGVDDADLVLNLGGERIAYRPVAGQPGRYEPDHPAETPIPARVPFSVQAQWRQQHAVAESSVPPLLRLDSVQIDVPDVPVDGIILDSLFIDPARLDSLQIDSLKTGVQGFVYLVEVTLWWTMDFDEVGPDSAYWVRTQLKPVLSNRPIFDDFFFRPEQLVRERTMELDGWGRRSWTGAYAVPVTGSDEPLPPHALRIAIIRSTQDYARYAASRRDPERREPVSNVEGGIGIVAGVSVDSVWVRVE